MKTGVTSDSAAVKACVPIPHSGGGRRDDPPRAMPERAIAD